MDQEYFIGIDIGTSAVKGVLCDKTGTRMTSHQSPIVVRQLDGIRVETNAESYLDSVFGLVRRLGLVVPADGRIVAISIAAASGNTLLSDDEGRPLRPIISWRDTRMVGETRRLLPWLDANEVHRVVGWPYVEMFPLAHLAWLRAHEPDLLDSASHVGMAIDFLYHRLTGRWVLDRSTATTFYLQDQPHASYHSPFLERLGLRQSQLPAIEETGSLAGIMTPETCQLSGTDLETKVILGCFDHPAAARASFIREPGQILLATGTSWVCLYVSHNRDSLVNAGFLVDPYLTPEGPWAGMFALTAVGATINDLVARKFSHSAKQFASFERAASVGAPGKGALAMRLFDQTGQPILPSGVDHSLSAADFSLGLMESVAFELRKRIEYYASLGFAANQITMVGGAAQNAVWRQVISNVMRMPIQSSGSSFTGAEGAAMIAASASFERVQQEPSSESVPDLGQSKIYEALYRRYRDD